MMKRITYIDNLKCFAIMLVMLGHAIQYLSGAHYADNPVFSFIYSFHMPLFMAMSGYFFRSSLNIDIGAFFKKKFIALILPALSWTVLVIALSGGGYFWTKMFVKFWFLKSTFVCYIVCYLMVKMTHSELVAYSLILILSMTINFHSGPFDLNSMLPSFVLGIIYSVYADKILKRRMLILLLSAATYMISFHFWHFSEKPIADFGMAFFTVHGFRMLVSLSGTIALLLIFSYLNKTSDTIAFIGKSTLSFYVLNTFFTDILRHLINVTIENELTCYFVSLTVLVIQVPLFIYITSVLNRNSYSKLLLLGRK